MVLPMVVLATLIAINAVLIALLLQSQRKITAEPAAQLRSTGTSEAQRLPSSPAQDSPSVSQSPSTPSTPTPVQKVAVPTRLLVATSKTNAWRATVGDCKTPGRVERSTDGGKSWKRAVNDTLSPIMGLEVESNGNLYAVGGAGDDCALYYIAYSKDGAIAARTDQPQGVWSRNPRKPDQIQGPGFARATPCKSRHVLGLAALNDSQALVVCMGGSVIVTSNSGRSWKKADQLVGSMAVAAGGGRYWVAGQGKTCNGIAIQSFSLTGGKPSRGDRRCATNLTLTPGRIAIDVSGKAIWLWAGDDVHVSTDRGRTWKAQ